MTIDEYDAVRLKLAQEGNERILQYWTSEAGKRDKVQAQRRYANAARRYSYPDNGKYETQHAKKQRALKAAREAEQAALSPEQVTEPT